MASFRIDYRGDKHLIVFSRDAERSVRDLAKDPNRVDRLARYNALAKRLADVGSITSPNDFVKEDDGFFAIKATPIRAYGWWSKCCDEKGRSVTCFVISHFVEKKQNKLSDADKRRMLKNRDQFQESDILSETFRR